MIINRVRDAISRMPINLSDSSAVQRLYRPRQTSFTLPRSPPSLADELFVGMN